jgi:FkbH-like protein
MKLIDALRIANEPQQGPEYDVLLACGFTPLHLATALKAHMHLALPHRTIRICTGLFDDLAGTLENWDRRADAVTIVLEWADLDRRLGWRTMGNSLDGIIEDASTMLRRIARAIDQLSECASVALSLPAVPFAPVFHTNPLEFNYIERSLWNMIYTTAASTSATAVRPRPPATSIVHDLRSELSNGFPYSFAYADALAQALTAGILPPPPKKGLITDLDETLWHGVLGDDGPEGISWDFERCTRFYGLYQHLLNSLAARGTLLAVASKNDPQLAAEALQRTDLVVDRNNLFPIEVHWAAKTQSIERILHVWNIGEDSVVFVDDNALELEQVKRAFPAMECVQFRTDDPQFLTQLNAKFAKRRIFEEDALRSSSLRATNPLAHAPTAGSLDEILSGAQATIAASWGKNPADERALELINKTNQFNLNGFRYTEGEWREFLRDPATHVLVVEYADRFAKLGKIAVLAGRARDGTFDVSTWVMSCRAFSRRIEHQCLNLVFQRWDRMRVRYRATERNSPLREFLSNAGISGEITRKQFQDSCPALFHQTEVKINE